MKRALYLLVLVCGCRSRNDSTAPAATTTSSASIVAPAAPPSAPVVAAPPEPALPTSEDFEESVNREISGTNLERELDKLERELEKP